MCYCCLLLSVCMHRRFVSVSLDWHLSMRGFGMPCCRDQQLQSFNPFHLQNTHKNQQALRWWFGGLGFFFGLLGVVSLTSPGSLNPVVRDVTLAISALWFFGIVNHNGRGWMGGPWRVLPVLLFSFDPTSPFLSFYSRLTAPCSPLLSVSAYPTPPSLSL